MKRPHTITLFILSRTIREARDAAAPISNANAKDIASQSGFDNLKKSITCMVDIIETIRYKTTKVDITNPLINLFLSKCFCKC